MYASWLAVLALTGLAPSAAAPPLQCAATAERSATRPATGATLARITARAGSLRIEGRAGLREVRVRGTACATSRALLGRVRIGAERSGTELRITAEIPNEPSSGNQYASLDLVVEVPEALALDVSDGSGDHEIHHVGALTLDDGSGGIDLSDVSGAVRIEDGSGDVHLEKVRGDVYLVDSSGELVVRDVEGSVEVAEDSSGEIRIDRVARNVLVRDDSSGSIFVTGVRGNFTVDRDGSGSIRYSEIAGRVRVPAD